MAIWRKLLAFAALLPGFAGAVDPSLMDLIMPDARVVAGINAARILASPIGQTIKGQIQSQIQKAGPQWQQQMQMVGLAGVDWSQYVQEVLIASPGGPGKNPPFLMIVRGSLDPARLESLKAFTGGLTDYQGVPLLVSTGKSNTAIAFLGGSVAIFGQPADVKAAIRRRGQHSSPPADLAEKVKQSNQRFDAWLVSTGPLSAPAPVSSAGVKTDFLQNLEGFRGGVRFSPDFDLSAEIVARTEKDAAAMAEGLRWLYGAVQAQAKNSARKDATGLENMKFEVKGRRILLSLQVPERMVRAALQQTRVSPRAPAPAPQTAPSGGLPPPPPGTIRIESSPSDMGTVLLPTGKAQ